MTVAQGHILSEELLTELGFQAAMGVARAEISLDEIEDVFRRADQEAPTRNAG